MTERLRTIAQIWNWLPAFRAVAETEHLPTASEMMGITAPALSRTVKQLEEHVGYPLFRRRGRNLELNDEGRSLLVAVRDAMRRVDDALSANLDQRFSGAFRWTSNWALSGVVIAALRDMVSDHPALRPSMLTTSDRLIEDLQQGKLDLAVVYSEMRGNGIDSTHLGESPLSVYCGREHPLFGRQVEWHDLEGQHFCAPTPTTSGVHLDGWPPARTRQVVMEFAQMAQGFRACRDTDLLAVLPDNVARDEIGLWRLLPVELTRHAFAIHRTQFDASGPVADCLERLKRIIRTEPT